ncbi:MAG: 2-dehydropantoate 2-reductase [Clostridiales bacterium]|nr:2-dehydropantoate 2-reductase [Clostridiales bacterium]
MKRYAIYGAGSLGTVLGAFITKNGEKIDLINRNKAHVAALNEKGAHITGTVDMTVPVHAITPDQMEGKYDVILLLTKQLENDQVVTMLKDYLLEDGVIVTLQNGLPEPGIAKIIGENRTMGCTVEWGAALIAPGECALTSQVDSLSFHMGKMPGISKAQYDTVKALLEKMCPVHEEENLLGARWSKLLINATFSGLGTVMGGTFGSVSGSKAGQRVAIRCMKECIDVGHAMKVTFAPVQGKDITKLFYYKGALKRAIGCRLIPIAMKKHRAIEPSMLQDLKKGKPCEVDAINGAVCRAGKELGVPTPINDRIVRFIHQIQEGTMKAQAANIVLFDDLL